MNERGAPGTKPDRARGEIVGASGVRRGVMAVPFRGRAQKLRGTNASVVKLHNRSIVIRALLQHGPLSRHTLAHLPGMMPSTITYVVAELAAAGLVREIGPDTSVTNAGGGR